MLTPLEIQNKEFSRSLRGYDAGEVDEFLVQVFSTVDTLLVEQSQLIQKTDALEKELERFEKIEHTLKEALVVAQSTAEELVKQAKEKATVIVDKAEITARKRLGEVDTEMQRVRNQRAELLEKNQQFRMEFRALLTAYLERIDDKNLDG